MSEVEDSVPREADPPSPLPNVKNPNHRPERIIFVIYLALVLLFFGVLGLTLSKGIRNSERLKFLVAGRLQSFINELSKISREGPSLKERENSRDNFEATSSSVTHSEATSSSRVRIEVNISGGPKPSSRRSLPTNPPRISYFTPTPWPSIIPGQPGSKEWEEEFWRRWEELGKKNAEFQKQVEAAQKEFCQSHPALCQENWPSPYIF